jgi:DNA-binding transcriptional LysR family regulator
MVKMTRPSIDPTLLTTFLAVLEAGKISAAAKAVHLSQPAVTAQIRKLEESIGAALFVRSVQGVTATDAGLRLARYAKSIRRLLDEAMTEVPGGEDNVGPLVIAASTTIAAHLLPTLLAQFRAAHRGVPLHVHVGNTEDVVEEVRGGRVPIGLVEGHARASGVTLTPFVDDEIVLIIGATGVARDANINVRRARDLENVTLLWREAGSGTRAVVERALGKAKIVRRRSVRDHDVELGSTEAIIGGVVAGLGVAFVSRWSVRVHLAAGVVRVVPGLDLVVKRTFHWALPAGGLNGTAARFHAFAQRAPLVA